MKLLLLGTGGYHPTDFRHTACFMIPELGIVLDAGTAMYRVRDELATPELDIFLTHAHLDHVVGLTYLLDVLYEKNLQRVTVHGAEAKLAAVLEHLFSEPIFPIRPACEFRTLADVTPLAGGGRLIHFPLVHPGGALGFRLDWPGHSLAYVTDTTAAADAGYREHLRGVDLLIHECTFPDGYDELAARTGHSCLSPVAELAQSWAGVGRLVLVHVNSLYNSAEPLDLAPARAIFPQVAIGHDRMAVEF